jgi:hypothetical protein
MLATDHHRDRRFAGFVLDDGMIGNPIASAAIAVASRVSRFVNPLRVLHATCVDNYQMAKDDPSRVAVTPDSSFSKALFNRVRLP